MKVVVLVEGRTEFVVLPDFFRRWLGKQGHTGVAVKPVDLGGAGDYLKEFANQAQIFLGAKDCLGVIGVLDYHECRLDFPRNLTLDQQCEWGKKHLEGKVRSSKFRQHFAVHELEAWLFSDPRIFPTGIADKVPNKEPETINHTTPPAAVLRSMYHNHLNKKYKKAIDGKALFDKLDPVHAASRCPHLKLLLDDLVALVRPAA